MSFVFRAARDISPPMNDRSSLLQLAISDRQNSRPSVKGSHPRFRKNLIKGLSGFVSRNVSTDQSTIEDTGCQQLQLFKQPQRKSVNQSIGSVFKSYREWEADLSSSINEHSIVGPGSYAIPNSWQKRPSRLKSPNKNLSNQDSLHKQLQSIWRNQPPSIPSEEKKLPYQLASNGSLVTINNQPAQLSTNKISLMNTPEDNGRKKEPLKGPNFHSSKTKRTAFPINAATSMAGYPTHQHHLNYKCKNSSMFDGTFKKKMESQSERVLKRLFCGSQIQKEVYEDVDKQNNFSPGPGTYNIDPMKANLSTKDKQIPFMSGQMRAGIFSKITYSVGPTSYNLNQPMGQTNTKSAAFMSQVKRGQSNQSNPTPAVGTYSVASQIVSSAGQHYITGSPCEGRVWHEHIQSSPGPAHYTNDPLSLVYKNKYNYQPQPVFRSQAQRQLFSKYIFQEKPGPGTYQFDPTKISAQIPENLQPLSTSFMSSAQRFEPLRKQMDIIDEAKIQKPKKKLKTPKKQPVRRPFNNSADRFPLWSSPPTPPIGIYYDQDNDFRGWETKTFNRLFINE